MEEKIVGKALELFNANGIEYVGMRELAAALGTKLGNITYYFPTKEDLITRISQDLSALNAGVLRAEPDLSIRSFFSMLQQHFQNQVQYRCLLLSFVHLIHNYPKITERYGQIEEQRRGSVRDIITQLIANKYLKQLSEAEQAFLDANLTLIARFWISEAAVTHRKLKPPAQIRYYLHLIAQLLLPYATAKGRKELAEF